MDYQKLSIENFVSITLMALIGFVLPLGVALFWKIKKKERFTTVLIGAGIFFGFAIILESIPKLLFFTDSNPVGNYVLNHAWAYTLAGALLAGLFEEGGRFFAFKVLLKRRTNKETAISYGIGHGGFEVLYILGLNGIVYLVYGIMINTGMYATLVAETAATAPAQVAQMDALADVLAGIGYSNVLLSLWERISAMLLHVGCSVLVFKAANEKKSICFFPLAIVFHACLDVFAALYQFGVITNVYVLEGVICILSIAVFSMGLWIYRGDRKQDSSLA